MTCLLYASLNHINSGIVMKQYLINVIVFFFKVRKCIKGYLVLNEKNYLSNNLVEDDFNERFTC